MKKREIEMTTGSLAGNILRFSLPLIASNVLQVFFNMADVAVVGRFAGNIALGSVGSTSVLVFLMTGILLGLASGVNALTARFAGAQDADNIRKCVNTSLFLCLAAGAAVAGLGIPLSGPILRLMGTKPELIGGAVKYMRIYLLGMPALGIYNFGNGVLNAVGDTKRPLKYLTLAGVSNVILNLFFVIVLDLEVAGVAVASVISQYLSAFLILRCLLHEGRDRKNYGLIPREIRCSRPILLQLLSLGLPAVFQFTVFAVANLFIQGAVNTFDHVVVEGNSAAANADSLVWDSMAAFYTASTSFIAQNLGAGKLDRVSETYGWTTLYSSLLGILMGGALILLRRPFLSIFTTDPEIIRWGEVRVIILGASYFISAFMDNATAAARGLGKSLMPTAIVFFGSVVYRIIWVYTVFAWFATLESLYLVFAAAWFITAAAGNIYYFSVLGKIRKSSNRQGKTESV